tara:strand:+ start:595 stop:933 length:339 start_codon:yes stop_codon:yes gene_type:complete
MYEANRFGQRLWEKIRSDPVLREMGGRGADFRICVTDAAGNTYEIFEDDAALHVSEGEGFSETPRSFWEHDEGVSDEFIERLNPAQLQSFLTQLKGERLPDPPQRFSMRSKE